MSLSDLASVASLVSSVAVLISLVYLALQVRQAAFNQRSEVQSNTTARRMDFLLHLAEPNAAQIALMGASADAKIDPLQLFQFTNLMQAMLANAEEEFFQHENGLLDERRFNIQLGILRNMFSLPGFRATWRTARGIFHPRFVTFMDGIMQSVSVSAADTTELWKALAAEERAAATAA